MTVQSRPRAFRSRILRWVTFALALLIAGCGHAEPSTPAIGEEYEGPAVRVTIGGSMQVSDAARTVRIFAAFDPVLLRGTWGHAGVLDSAKWSPMDLHPVDSMRVCFSRDGPCQPEGEWRPYEVVVERTVSVAHEESARIWLGAAFRDVNDEPVPAFVDPSAPQDLISASIRLSPGN